MSSRSCSCQAVPTSQPMPRGVRRETKIDLAEPRSGNLAKFEGLGTRRAHKVKRHQQLRLDHQAAGLLAQISFFSVAKYVLGRMGTSRMRNSGASSATTSLPLPMGFSK